MTDAAQFDSPTRNPSSRDEPVARAEVVVAGAGLVGLVLGVALARGGVDVAVVGRRAGKAPGRTVALLEGSIALLERLDLWRDLAAAAEPLRAMRIVDDTGSLFRLPPVTFRAAEIGRDRFGCNIPNDELLVGLLEAARRTPGLRLVDASILGSRVAAETASVVLDGDRTLEAALVIGCDGRESRVRTGARIGARSWRYPQVALTATLFHERPHGGISTEFHTREGPFTLVPLPDGPNSRPKSSLVWVMAPGEAERRQRLSLEALGREIDRRAQGLLGPVTVEGDLGRFPLGGLVADRITSDRVVLAGEAAHALPPIGAQGLNLGLRDVSALERLLVDGKRRDADLGGRDLLDGYDRARRGDILVRTLAVDGLNRSLLAPFLPVDALRGAGLLALATIPALRRAIMREGLMPAETRH